MTPDMFPLGFDQYQTALNKLAGDAPPADPRPLMVGMTTQVNRLSIAVHEPVDLNRIEEELGGMLWYLSELCTHYRLDFGLVAMKDLQRRKNPEMFVNTGGNTDG